MASSSAPSTTRSGRLAHRVAIITGAGSGIGLESALLFASEGASVVAADINFPAAEHTVELIKQRGGEAFASRTDVSKEAELKEVVRQTVERYGRLDIMFNNVRGSDAECRFVRDLAQAGIMHPDDDNAFTTEERIWDLTHLINVKGVWWGCRYAIEAMRNNKADASKGLHIGGSIINTASFVAILGAATPQLAYTASKGAVLAMTRELAAVHAKEGIRLNSLCPGPLRTRARPLNHCMLFAGLEHTALLMNFLNTQEKRDRRLVHVPMGRFGEAIEQARAALFLASDDSSYITGTDLNVDGGLTSTYVTPLGEQQLEPPPSLASGEYAKPPTS